MDSSWTVCPYCQKTGYRDAGLKATNVEGASAPPYSTNSPPPPQTAASSSAARKTVLLSQKYKAPVVGWFVALDGEHKGEDFRLRDGQNVIGTDGGCDIVLRDSTVSSRHASLRHKDGKFLLSDLDSSNGTYLNEQTETLAREELKDNDTVRFGDVRFKFKCL
jgi:hypothetical protein